MYNLCVLHQEVVRFWSCRSGHLQLAWSFVTKDFMEKIVTECFSEKRPVANDLNPPAMYMYSTRRVDPCWNGGIMQRSQVACH